MNVLKKVKRLQKDLIWMLENSVDKEKELWIEEDDFYRKSDEYIKQIEENGRNSLLHIS